MQQQYSVLVQGVSRIRVLSLSEDGPMLLGTVIRLKDQGSVADAEVREDASSFLCVERFRVSWCHGIPANAMMALAGYVCEDKRVRCV